MKNNNIWVSDLEENELFIKKIVRFYLIYG